MHESLTTHVMFSSVKHLLLMASYCHNF